MAGTKPLAPRRKKKVGPLRPPKIKRVGKPRKAISSGPSLPKRGPGDHGVGDQKIRKT